MLQSVSWILAGPNWPLGCDAGRQHHPRRHELPTLAHEGAQAVFQRLTTLVAGGVLPPTGTTHSTVGGGGWCGEWRTD
ncbi:MAG: hypothetical protein R3E79_13870 [Caldilineaceae bacterium]